jgi:hypothetical protein
MDTRTSLIAFRRVMAEPRVIDGLRRASDRPLLVACAGALVAIVVVCTFALVSSRGVSGFVHAGPPFADPRRTPGSLATVPADKSFDGQFYYRMAIAPFSTARVVDGVVFDTPVLRSARIGYPLLAYGASLGGDDSLVPFALVLVNVLAIFVLTLFGAELARLLGRTAAWGLLLPLYPGFVYSLGFDLTEIVTSACLVGALVCLRRRLTAAAMLLTTYAVFTRETAAVLPAALVLAWGWARINKRPSTTDDRAQLLVGAVPLAAAAVLQLALRQQWGKFPLQDSSDTNVVAPLSGFVKSFSYFFPPTNGGDLFRDASLALLVFVVVAAAIALPRSRAATYEKLAFVFGAIVATLPNRYIWTGATSFVRGATEAYVFAIVVLLGARLKLDRWVAAAVIAMFGLTFVSEVTKLT